MLQEFSGKDMIEQITILEKIRETGQIDVLPELMEIYASGQEDQAVDEMIYHCLSSLIEGQTKAIAYGLAHSSPKLQLLCARRAKQDAAHDLKEPLVSLLNSTNDSEVKAETIGALGALGDPELTSTVMPYINADDDALAAWAMHAIVRMGAESGRKAICDLVEAQAQLAHSSGGCTLKGAQAVSCVADYHDEAAADFLVNYIHHNTPSFRRIVISALAEMEEEVLPAMERCLASGTADEKIMAANIVGWTGLKKGSDLLIAALDRDEKLGTNLKFALYEGLGRIASMRSFIGLTDGLAETDEMVLMAVITGLNDLCNPGIVKVLNELFDKKDAQSRLVMQTIVTTRAGKLFNEVYTAGSHANALIQTIVDSSDKEAAEFFHGLLANIIGTNTKDDMDRLRQVKQAAANRRILAADDSKAMLFFYKGAAVDLGLELVTVTDGQEALDYLKAGGKIDLMITDMNMPNMDGIELTTILRSNPQFERMPILMVTTESEKNQIDHAHKAGVNAFLSKPFTKEDFKIKLKEFFSN